MKHAITILFAFCLKLTGWAQVLQPVGPVPTEAQLKWQSLGMIAIVHFGLNTFTHQEWGYGDVDPNLFQPAHFDADQIVRAAKAGGIRGIILVAKHHDGFCLWPTKTTDYSVRASSWMRGQGDVVKAFAEACHREGLAFGLYCSPWDRNQAAYGTYRYVQLYRQQWEELATQYGPLFECWFDGANGGTGYYGGAREKRVIDRSHYYGWDTTWALIRRLQPRAVIFSDVGPDLRWVGNERGYAADSTWETFTPQSPDDKPPAPGQVRTEFSPYGTARGEYWMPAECDVPLRPGWFYHPEEEGKQKTPAQLWEIYVHSVGRAGVLNLGLTPTTDGVLDTQDVRILKVFGDWLKQVFDTNLIKTARIQGPAHMQQSYGNRLKQWLTDGNDTTDWIVAAAHQGNAFSRDPQTLEVWWDEPQTFRLIQLKEDIRYGQRIQQVRVEALTSKGWETLAQVSGIGANRLIDLPKSVTARALRFHILAPDGFAMGEMGVYSYRNLPAWP